ncbi:efflux transporter outer membrane subunit [bacterium]|nr:efflux transporter outer membrane subunit [bacterium]
MPISKMSKYLLLVVIALTYASCVPSLMQKTADKTTPESYRGTTDTTNSATIKWRDFFKDPYLVGLIDTALQNNQELNIILQEIAATRTEIQARKGAYLPFVNLKAGTGADKVGRYTSRGANDANTEIMPGKDFPDPLGNNTLQAMASWEVDIWRKLRNARQSAVYQYLASVEGKNFMVTNLVAEVANSYYELLALDNQLDILNKNIQIQRNALKIVRQQKQAAKVTELAVRKFEAEVLKNRARLYYYRQSIIEAENRINFLVGRFPQPVARNSANFASLLPDSIFAGIPSQLLQNRPDIRAAEQMLLAANLDVQVAKAEFYPSLNITAGLGFEAFNPKYLVTTPESMLYNLAGELVSPFVNRNAIKANYNKAGAKQIQAAFEYERTILMAFTDVVNQLSNIDNLARSYDLKSKQVRALTQSITISTNLFKSAKADYMEVLMTQRDALEAKIELIETKRHQMNAMVNIYQALGGGWR